MSCGFALNEHSFPGSDSKYGAREKMADLIDVVRSGVSIGMPLSLRAIGNVWSLTIAPNYTITGWTNDQEVDLEARLFMKSMLITVGTIDSVFDEIRDGRHCEVKHNGTRAYGLGWALFNNDLAVSINQDDWDLPVVRVLVECRDERENTESEEDEVLHASLPVHIEHNQGAILGILMASVRDGEELWNKWEDIFAGLRFSEATRPQILALNRNGPHFNQVKKRLCQLNAYCIDWNEGGFDPSQIPNCSPESQATLDRYGKGRRFTDVNGQVRVLSWHVRFTPGPGRIYFEPDPNTRLLHVGYVGQKLPTVDYS